MAKKNSNNASAVSQEQIEQLIRSIIDIAKNQAQKVLDVGSAQQNAINNRSAVDKFGDYVDDHHIGTETHGAAELLKSFQNGYSSLDSLATYLQTLSEDTEFSKERHDYLYQYLLSMIANQNQREFDLSQLKDSRDYNNPMNSLARLLGAGLSRTEAIQQLSGGASGSGAGGSVIGSMSGVTPNMLATSGSQDIQRAMAGAQVANSVVQMVGSLCDTGLSLAQGVSTAQMLQAQNYMTQQQKTSFDAVNSVTSALQDAVTNGVLEPADFDSWQNADDVYKWLNDHADTNQFKPLIDSGAFKQCFGTTMGREMFNNHWHQVRDSRDYGRQVDQFLKQNDLRNELANMDFKQSLIDYNKALSTMDEYIRLFEQQVENGDIQIQIAGEEFKIIKNQAQISNYEVNQAATNNEIFDNIYNNPSGADGSGVAGKTYLSWATWNDLYDNFRRSAIKFEGDNKEKYEQLLQNNYDAAYNASFIKWYMSQNLESAWNPDRNPGVSAIMGIGQLFNASGLLPLIDMNINAANIGANIIDRTDRTGIMRKSAEIGAQVLLHRGFK